eukprot:1718464-Rhodomonas_salina.1
MPVKLSTNLTRTSTIALLEWQEEQEKRVAASEEEGIALRRASIASAEEEAHLTEERCERGGFGMEKGGEGRGLLKRDEGGGEEGADLEASSVQHLC